VVTARERGQQLPAQRVRRQPDERRNLHVREGTSNGLDGKCASLTRRSHHP
jgi:hypothetical protein